MCWLDSDTWRLMLWVQISNIKWGLTPADKVLVNITHMIVSLITPHDHWMSLYLWLWWCSCLGYLSRTEFPCDHITSLVSQANTGQGQALGSWAPHSPESPHACQDSQDSSHPTKVHWDISTHSHAPKKLSVILWKGHWKEIWQCNVQHTSGFCKIDGNFITVVNSYL